jgi:hypothetical protein
MSKRDTIVVPHVNENVHKSDFGIKTKQWVSTSLANIQNRHLDVRVTNGMVESKSTLMSTTHFLTYEIDVP